MPLILFLALGIRHYARAAGVLHHGARVTATVVYNPMGDANSVVVQYDTPAGVERSSVGDIGNLADYPDGTGVSIAYDRTDPGYAVLTSDPYPVGWEFVPVFFLSLILAYGLYRSRNGKRRLRPLVTQRPRTVQLTAERREHRQGRGHALGSWVTLIDHDVPIAELWISPGQAFLPGVGPRWVFVYGLIEPGHDVVIADPVWGGAGAGTILFTPDPPAARTAGADQIA